MNHNQYALHIVNAQITRAVRELVSQDETCHVGSRTTIEELRIVAPSGELGNDIVKVYLKYTFQYGDAQLVKIVSHEQKKLSAIVRYEDAYRGRM